MRRRSFARFPAGCVASTPQGSVGASLLGHETALTAARNELGENRVPVSARLRLQRVQGRHIGRLDLTAQIESAVAVHERGASPILARTTQADAIDQGTEIGRHLDRKRVAAQPRAGLGY